MNQPQRRPGRPAGTDYSEDLVALAMVADKLIASPGLKAMTAMKAVYDSKRWQGRGGSQRDTTVARWLRKWPDHAEAVLAAARQRSLKSSRAHRTDVTTPSTPWPAPAGATWPNSVTSNMFSTQAVAAAAAAMPSADFLRTVKIATQGLRDFEKSYRPAMEAMAHSAKAIREAFPVVPPHNSALAASLAAVKVPQVPDSVIEQFRQISNSPTIIAMREFLKNAKQS
jgi:hypothetical protein